MPRHHPLTRQDIDDQPCEECGSSHTTSGDPMELHACCHSRAGLDVAYHQGVLILRCRKCAAFVEHFAIAREADQVAVAH